MSDGSGSGSDSGDGRPDPLARAHDLAPLIEASAAEGERLRRLPEPLVAALHDAGFYRLLLPRSLDGAELDPAAFVRVMEAVSRADASAAWCLCQASGCTMITGTWRPTWRARSSATGGSPRLGAEPGRPRGARRRRLPRLGHLHLRERLPPGDVARRPVRDPRARRDAAAPA